MSLQHQHSSISSSIENDVREAFASLLVENFNIWPSIRSFPPEAKAKYVLTALELAGADKNEEIVRWLLVNSGIDITLKRSVRSTLAPILAQGDKESQVLSIIGDCKDIIRDTVYRMTALDWAVKDRDIAMANLLLGKGVYAGEFPPRSSFPSTIYFAVLNGDYRMVKLLLDSIKWEKDGLPEWEDEDDQEMEVRPMSIIFYKDRHGRTAFEYAVVVLGSQDIAKLFLNLPWTEFRHKPLSIGVNHKYGGETLLDQVVKNRYYQNPTAANKNLAMIGFLLEEGALLNMSRSCLTIVAAARSGVDILSTGRAPLKGDLRIVKILLEHRTDINLCGPDGKALIHHVVFDNNEEMLELLMRNGADVNRQDRSGLTPIYYAYHRDHDSIHRKLIRLGANTNVEGAPNSRIYWEREERGGRRR